MHYFEQLRQQVSEIEEGTAHAGYYYRIRDILSIVLCGLETVGDIHEWSKARPTRQFLHEQFGIEKLPCRAQFYNILACVDAGQSADFA